MKFSNTQLFDQILYRWAHHCELRWIERVIVWLIRKGWLR